jgi:hypothetical protein
LIHLRTVLGEAPTSAATSRTSSIRGVLGRFGRLGTSTSAAFANTALAQCLRPRDVRERWRTTSSPRILYRPPAVPSRTALTQPSRHHSETLRRPTPQSSETSRQSSRTSSRATARFCHEWSSDDMADAMRLIQLRDGSLGQQKPTVSAYEDRGTGEPARRRHHRAGLGGVETGAGVEGGAARPGEPPTPGRCVGDAAGTVGGAPTVGTAVAGPSTVPGEAPSKRGSDRQVISIEMRVTRELLYPLAQPSPPLKDE